ncbi:hypothetical protein THASP1DRAFT_28978 [Thamnocephalis sphaerospora]|uniref:Uncharacterized protein n=1 Tax=Thamnocephalis sphaerospora TaxID=78915 RepID=A0A4P9XSU2_9FUNG|nr:hypothetical protein THASP1DRAFT_28978 [Thamnocephalis sphaerospora]|eukprot:RKP09225.1 hypothetical protein THASP1DRAFT_28978 [Thamnocephalis sphaerospora]
MKAYVAHERSLMLLYLGTFLVVMQFTPLVMLMRETKVFMTPNYACTVEAPAYYPWLRLGLDLPVNMFFSVAFLYVVFNNYTRYGSDAWQRLSHEGIIYMFLAAALNIASAAIMAGQLLKGHSSYVYFIDWYLSSYLILIQQRRTAINVGGSGRTLTARMQKSQERTLLS